MFRVYRSLEAAGPEVQPCAVSIGNFDGVHRGHQVLLARNLDLARANGWIPSALTFDPHPTTVVAPQRAPRLLTSMEQRVAFIQALGIEQVFVLTFSQEFSRLSPFDFAKRVLVDGCGARAVLVGDNFRFGHKQAGDVEVLRRIGNELGFCTEVVAGVKVRGRMVSSSEVRHCIQLGNVSLACRLLGRPYALEGVIVSGAGIGSKQTVPTLNLDTSAEVIPARGVYITRTYEQDSARQWPSITNIGFRPTFHGDRQTIETWLLAPLEGASPARIRLEFLRRVREERKFDSAEALKAQILRDAGRAQTWFRRVDATSRRTPLC
jgi:riboflavin kinase/FMN adenylyltransferase